jgi:hypothetical protein
MSNPFEFRENMLSAFGWSDKTIDQLTTERKSREQAEKRLPKGRRGPARKAPSTTASPRQAELARLQDLMRNAKPRQQPVSE